MTSQAQQDGYIECSECGHPIEQHDKKGCVVCRDAGAPSPCTETWTKTEIRNRRIWDGLPPRWE